MSHIGKTFWFFFSHYPRQTVLVVFLLLVSGIIEAFGIAAFLPFLKIFLEGKTIESLPLPLLDHLLKSYGLTLNLTTIGGMIIVLMTLKSVVLWLAMYRVSQTVAIIANDFRHRYMNALLRANWRFFAAHSLGRSLNAIATETFRGSLTFVSITRFLANCIQFAVYIGSAFIISWQVSAGILAVGAVTALILWVFVRIARRAGVRQTEAIKAMMAQMGDVLQGIKALRAMALEQKFMGMLQGFSRDLQKSQVDQLLSAQSLRIFHEPLMVLSAVIGIFVAVQAGGLAGSSMVLIILLFIKTMTGLNSAQSEYQRLGQEESALWSLMETIQKIDAAVEPDAGTQAPPAQLETITFDRVGFSYDDRPVLTHMDLIFRRHTLCVLIGESGSGKTTVLDLICGLSLPESGKILVNDINLHDLSLKAWRNTIGFVPQEVFLFNDSVFHNIAMGRPDITEQDVWAALDAVDARDFVTQMPGGLHAPVGENGRMLSGGQRQRLSIARAIVGKPQLLLLDEPTSALDKDTEQILLQTLKKLSRDMMVILVTHNPAVLDFADTVYKIGGR